MHQFIMEFWENFRHNLFKPLLLFFYMGFLVPILRVKLDFPHMIYQGLTIYLLIAIGWHGGEELATLKASELANAGGFMLVGVVTNFFIGITAYMILRAFTRLRRIDAATVAGYYGSDSAGTFATCVGVLVTAKIAFAAYMPVMLAVMEIPGCLVALYLVSTLRRKGMDPLGNMPDEPGYNPKAAADHGGPRRRPRAASHEAVAHARAVKEEAELALEPMDLEDEFVPQADKKAPLLSPELLHEVFLNPGIYLLIAGIAIGFISGYQGYGKRSRQGLPRPVPRPALPLPARDGDDGLAEDQGPEGGGLAVRRLRDRRAQPLRDDRDRRRARLQHGDAPAIRASAPTSCSRSFAVPPRISRSRRCSGWRSPRPAPRSPWPPRSA